MFLLAQATPQMPQLPPLPEGPDLARLRPPVEVAAAPQIWPIIAALLAATLIILLRVWIIQNGRKRNIPQVDPETAALVDIENAQSIAKDDISYASICSRSVKRLLADHYHISQGQGFTSEELLRKLPIETENKTKLRHFLETCDSVKFAQGELNDSERESISETAKAIILANRRKEFAE